MSKIGLSLLSLPITTAGPVASGRLVGFDGAQATVQGQPIKGVADYAASAAGETITVTARGTAYVEAGGPIAAGDPIISDSQGRAIAAAALGIAAGTTGVTSSAANGTTVLTGGASPDHVVGRALEAGAGAGAIIEILI